MNYEVLVQVYHKRLTAYLSIGYSVRSNGTEYNIENKGNEL